ncbi:MAG: Hsp70 family protein [Acidimicrobiales bacterium]|nr:Hsp70 family protein [Acidimicrobiales bacterium]
MPTLVSISADRVLVGEDADAAGESTLVRSVKTALMNAAEQVAVTDKQGVRHKVAVDELICHVLTDVRERAERAGADTGGRVRLGCPAIWEAGPRRRLARLASESGLQASASDMLDEPIAAGVSWVWNSFVHGDGYPEGRVLVFDFGGGTLDVAVLDVERGAAPRITALAASGNSYAGDRIDKAIARRVWSQVDRSGAFRGDDVFEALLGRAAVRLKETLSGETEASTLVGGGYDDLSPLRLDAKVLAEIMQEPLEAARRAVERTLKLAGLRARNAETATLRATSFDKLTPQVDFVLAVGGMSRSRDVTAALRTWFPDAKVVKDPGVLAPEESVVSGLTVDDVVSELNLDRPAFSFVVEYHDRRTGELLDSETVYEAFSPMYEQHHLVNLAFDLRYSVELRPPRDRDVVAILSCVTLAGEKLDLRVDDRVLPGAPVYIGSRGGRFTLYVDGRITLVGQERLEMVVDEWPVIRSESRSSLRVRAKNQWVDQIEQFNWWVGGE